MSLLQVAGQMARENPEKWRFVKEAHQYQQDKQGKNYFINHLLPVAASVPLSLRWVALAHDILEDTDCNFNDLKTHGFSYHEINLIHKLTLRAGVRREAYLKLINADREATIVKVADIVNNLSRLHGLDKDTHDRLYSKYQESLLILMGVE